LTVWSHQFGTGGSFLSSPRALLGNPKQASAIPAKPTPNLFNACRRVTDWANPLASSSNLWFIAFPFVSVLFAS
jgi:hypothetical protein